MGLFSSSSSKSTSYLPVQAQWMKRLVPEYGAQVGQGQPVYEGQRVAPLTGAQQEAMDVGGWGQYLQPNANIPMYGQTGGALSGLLSGTAGGEEYSPQQIDSLFKSAYEQPTLKRWSDVVNPAIKEAYGGPGYWSSSRMEAERKGAQDTADWLGSAYGNLRWEAEQANQGLREAKAGRALSAIQPAMQYGQMPQQQTLNALQGRMGMYDLAGAGQQQQQAEINAAIQKFAERNRITDPESMEILMTLLGMNYSKTTQSGGGALSSMAGGFGEAFGGGLGTKLWDM